MTISNRLFLVTGGLGFIGKHFVSRCLELGNYVINVDVCNNAADITAKKEFEGHQNYRFYKGDIAKIIVRNIEENGGLITVKDVASYEPNMFEPLSSRYRDYEVVSGSPDCSGGRFVLESLNILENFDLKVFGATSFEYFHILSETFKQVWSDRLQYEADPCFTEIPAKGMLSKNYAKELKQRIFMHKASRFTAGNPWKYEGKHEMF